MGKRVTLLSSGLRRGCPPYEKNAFFRFDNGSCDALSRRRHRYKGLSGLCTLAVGRGQ
jgi:hypothetical protein